MKTTNKYLNTNGGYTFEIALCDTGSARRWQKYIEHENYSGFIRPLTEKEYSYYWELLNTDPDDTYLPYAIRVATKDVVSMNDNYHGFSNELFTRISSDKFYIDPLDARIKEGGR